MPEWFAFEDPLVRRIVYLSGALVLLIILLRFVQRRREAARWARRRRELQRTMGSVEMQQRERDRLAEKIIATSSGGTIAGFDIVRQIEALFTDNHRTPVDATQTIKALAAQKGGNAVINLSTHRLPSGKCVANGDAVIVRETPTSAPPPPRPEDDAERPPPNGDAERPSG